MKEKLTTVILKRTHPPKMHKTDVIRIKKMTDKELRANALRDKDNLPLTKKQLAQFKPVQPPKKVNVKAIREKLGLSQEKFARYFGVSIRTLQDWEQRRHQPNTTARNFLLVVSKEAKAVQRALG